MVTATGKVVLLLLLLLLGEGCFYEAKNVCFIQGIKPALKLHLIIIYAEKCIHVHTHTHTYTRST